uniref:Uncharacterized protein n=1 Tax=Sphaerodactylus townsendi TaxID=933632 RepID=A0ACB8EDG0_9SAUR
MFCKDTQTELAERVAAIDVAVGPDGVTQNGQGTVKEDETVSSKNAANNQRNGVNLDLGSSEELDGAHELTVLKRVPKRPNLSGRKYSLQEKPAGNYLTSADPQGFGPYATGPSTHISPRIVRRPTIESHRVSISDAADQL